MNPKEIHRGIAELQAIIDNGPSLVANDKRRSIISLIFERHPLWAFLGSMVLGGVIIFGVLIVAEMILVKRYALITPTVGHAKILPNTIPLDTSINRPREGRNLSIPVVIDHPVSPPKPKDNAQLFRQFQKEVEKNLFLTRCANDPGTADCPHVDHQALTVLRVQNDVHEHHAIYHRLHVYHRRILAAKMPIGEWCGYPRCPSNNAPPSENIR